MSAVHSLRLGSNTVSKLCRSVIFATVETQARLGLIGLILAAILYIFYWAATRWLKNHHDLFSAISFFSFPSAAGLSNDQIAERLVVSSATAKTHVSRAMIKLGARDRAQLVVIAYESGLVRPGWAE